GQVLVWRAAELAGENVGHHLARLAGLRATHPGLLAGLQVCEFLWDAARSKIAELMTADALAALERADPFDLSDIGGGVALAAALVGGRHFQHGIPVDRRIVLRRDGLARRRHRREIEMLAGLAVDLGGIDEAIAAYPDLELGLGEVGQ